MRLNIIMLIVLPINFVLLLFVYQAVSIGMLEDDRPIECRVNAAFNFPVSLYCYCFYCCRHINSSYQCFKPIWLKLYCHQDPAAYTQSIQEFSSPPRTWVAWWKLRLSTSNKQNCFKSYQNLWKLVGAVDQTLRSRLWSTNQLGEWRIIWVIAIWW